MTPEEHLHALRDDGRWERSPLRARAPLRGAASRRRDRRVAAPVLITAVVAVLVVIVSINVIRLADQRAGRVPAATVTPTVTGATATIRGTALTTTRIIAGAGRPGGPSAGEITRLQTLAKQVGELIGEPTTASTTDERLGAAEESVHAAFGPAIHDAGGTGPSISVFFLVLNRPPTAQETQLLRLLPFTVRLSWGPRLSVKERDRQQQSAFLAVKDVFDAYGDTESETDTQTLSFWPDRDHPRSAAQIAQQMAAVITRMSGAPPTFSIRVTDESRTPEGRAALQAVDHPVSDDGSRLLIAVRPTGNAAGVGVGGAYGLNPQRCVALGTAVVIAPPGSSISADGRTIHAKGLGSYPVTAGPSTASRGPGSGGGAFTDARAAATYLPRGSTLCGATRFVLIGR